MSRSLRFPLKRSASVDTINLDNGSGSNHSSTSNIADDGDCDWPDMNVDDDYGVSITNSIGIDDRFKEIYKTGSRETC
jgi:hypothetical protein